MAVKNKPKHPDLVPNLFLEREALGELSFTEEQALKQRLDALPEAERKSALVELQVRRDELQRDNAAILAAYPPEVLGPKIEQRARQQAASAGTARQRSAWPVLIPIGSALAMATLAAVLVHPPALFLPATPKDGNSQLEATRIKGLRPLLLIFSKPAAGEQPHALADGAAVKAHELLQLGYVAAGKPHGVVVSIDGRGTATLHYPTSPNQPTGLAPGQVLLPSAYELDDAPLFERFFLVTAKTPIDVAAVFAAADKLAADPAKARTAPLVLPPGLEQTSLLLVKP